MLWKSYQVMDNVRETLDALTQLDGLGRVVAGGTDLVVQVKEAESRSGALTLLDISRVNEMRGIEEIDGHIWIGAATTMTEIAGSSLVQSHARALAQGAGWLGSPQIRNVATIGGNVVNAMPAADTSVPLVALGARARVVSRHGERVMEMEELFLSAGESAIDPTRELVTDFLVEPTAPSRGASAMLRLAKRKAFTLPQLSVAVRVELEPDEHRFRTVRIVAGPVAPIPWRARRAEEALASEKITCDIIEKVAALARDDACPRDSMRCGTEYRRDMVAVLVKRAILDAVKQLDKAPDE